MRLLLFVLCLWSCAADAQAPRVVIGGAGVVHGGSSAESLSHVMFYGNNGGQGSGSPAQVVNRVRLSIGYAPAQVIEVVGGSSCTFDNDTRRLTIDSSAAPGSELATQTLCVVRYGYSGVVTFTEDTTQRQFVNLLGTTTPGTVTLGSLAVQQSPMSTPPNLTYTPNHNAQPTPDLNAEIVFPVAPLSTMTTIPISITAFGGTGGLGMASVSTCLAYRLTSGNAIIAFIPSVPQYNFGAGSNATVSFNVQCSRDSVEHRALVVCLEGQNPGSLQQRAWDVRCPAAGVIDAIFASSFE